MRRTVRWIAPTLLTLCALAAPVTASAASSKEIKEAVTKGLGYLKSRQLADGGFGEEFGEQWALSAFAAAGVADANVKAGSGGTDARDYYRALIGDTESWPGAGGSVGDFETAALAAYAAGIDPARVSASQNLIAQIVAHYQPADPGHYGEPGLFNDTVFALLALADTHTRTGKQRVPRALLEESIGAVRAGQHTDGGWSYAEGELEEPAEAELTGAAMAALCGAGVPASDPAILAAKKFLESQLEPSGAFATEFGPNTDSDAWPVEGLDACGISPQGAEFTTSAEKTPIDFLISQQLGEGGFRYEASETEPDFYSSQDAVRALAGAGFTVAPPKPKGAPQWLYEKSFSTSGSVTALLTLVIDNGSSVTPCAVPITPRATKTTLASVLVAAESSASPAGCVTAFTPAGGSGAITSIDGLPSPPAASWKLSIDGGSEKPAKRNTAIEIGDTIYLRLG